MLYRRNVAVSMLVLSCLVATAKDKKKVVLPTDVLKARTVLVMVDPDAGVDAQDPNANRAAREDVEKALVKWGRLMSVAGGSTADLIILVRKGNSKVARGTISGTGANTTPPVIVQSTDSTIHAAGRVGNMPVDNPSDPQWSGAGSGSPSGPTASDPRPQTEVGQSQDIFAVYRGGLGSDPLDAPAVWRYTAKNALASPDVPAVEVFRKLVAEPEKQLASGP